MREHDTTITLNEIGAMLRARSADPDGHTKTLPMSEYRAMVEDIEDCLRRRIVEWLRECEEVAVNKDYAAALHNAADGIEQRWGVA